jgi:spore coat protein H
MKSVILVVLFFSVLDIAVFSQELQQEANLPVFLVSDSRIENVITFNLPELKLRSLHSTTGKKMDVKSEDLVINSDTIQAKKINTRGKSTLMYRRKSLSLNLKSNATFYHGKKEEPMKRFKLLSLSMDKYYSHNRIAFELMETLDLYHLFYSYCDLRINDKSEGIFMVVERPEDWALHEKGSPMVIRRGFKHAIEEITINDTLEQADKRKYLENYKEIYRALNKYEGEELYETLKEYLDIDYYMTWLAFNFLIHNGDYSDEVFFYIDPEIDKYRILPWDYDDILVSSPHEGLKQRNISIGDKMLFSGEDLLDIKIARDPYLYGLYKKHLKEVLQAITPDKLKMVIENTFAELYPYYTDDQIISNAQYDAYKDASLVTLKSYLLQIYILLCNYQKSYLEYLD